MMDNLLKILFLKQEIEFLKDQINPEDSGHLYTTISVLGSRVQQLTEEMNNEMSELQ